MALDVSFLMRNIALLNAILSGISECFEEESQEEESHRLLSEQEAITVEQIASMLEEEEKDLNILDNSATATTFALVSVKVTLPETKLTFINDLQGLDEALLRVTIRNLVVGGQIRKWSTHKQGTVFFHCV